MAIYNNNYTSTHRNLIKRTDSGGAVPTIPTGVTSETDHSYGDWLSTDTYVGEFFLNTTDDKLWMRTDNGFILIGYSGMTGSFVDLSDTPSTYNTYGGYYLAVNSAETALNFIQAPTNTDAFLDLLDVDNISYSGYSGYSVVVNSAETALEFQLINSTFTNLDDTPTGYTADYYLKVNSVGTGIEYTDALNNFVGISNTQTVTGNKTFLGDITISGLTVNYLTMTETITSISTDSGFTSADNNTLSTSLAIKTYIDNIVYGSGVTNYTSYNENESITGEWTFSDVTNLYDTNVTGYLIVTGATFLLTNLNLSLSSYTYMGDETTDGSWRCFVNGDGNLETQKRVSGTWTTKQIIN